MLERGEWEPPWEKPIKGSLHLCLLRVECIRCRHSTDVSEHRLERLPPTLRFRELRDKLRCNHCDERGKVRLYIRRKPRN